MKAQIQKTDEINGDGFPVWLVVVDHQTVGTVFKVKTSKTGFKRNRCVGQVPCIRWRARNVEGKTVTGSERFPFSGSNGFPRRSDAVAALLGKLDE